VKRRRAGRKVLVVLIHGKIDLLQKSEISL
jgi:hypothetical protein